MPSSSTVLVVDDDAISRQLIENLVAQEGFTVVSATNGREALEFATRYSPDVVLLDVVMPDVDGFEVCRQLRADPALGQIPIILLTGLEGRHSRLRGLTAGADEFLTKPVDPIELRTRIRTITGLNRFRQLCDERARFETAIAYSPDSIVLTDGEGLVLHANNAFIHFVGRVPNRIYDCFPTATAALLEEQLNAGAPHGLQVEPMETGMLFSRVNGATAEVTVVRLPGSSGALFQFILRDITERKQLEAQLHRLQRIELLGQLASGVVHDVNNLLMAVMANADALDSKNARNPKENVQVIRQSAERGAALLRRILMFARGADQALLPVDVAPVLRETAAITAKLLGEAIALELQVPADLPAIYGDGSQLHQVVMNLCVNARDAMPDGGRLMVKAEAISLTSIEARAVGPDAVAGDFVAISVRDTGTGVAPENRERLFDPFFTTKPRETATGLGLATVLRVMRRHHGFIGFQTKVGSGTCFTCYFPTVSAVKPAPVPA
jgi:two-component system, cell cycle sensor histidine kinase and response regulator CckA